MTKIKLTKTAVDAVTFAAKEHTSCATRRARVSPEGNGSWPKDIYEMRREMARLRLVRESRRVVIAVDRSSERRGPAASATRAHSD